MWCVAELDRNHIKRMEDELALYEKPCQAAEPVVCLDEKPVSLLPDVRPLRPLQPGKLLRPDNEHKRCGTANVFGVVEPKAGRQFTSATPNWWTPLESGSAAAFGAGSRYTTPPNSEAG